MKYREGRCPKCNEVMQIPEDRDKIICMFCGQEFSVRESADAAMASYEHVLEDFRGRVDSLFADADRTVKGFQRTVYAERFESYLAEQRDNLTLMRSMIDVAVDRRRAAQEIAQVVVDSAARAMESMKGKIGREATQMNRNMYMVTFLLPALLYQEKEKYTDLADAICEKWSQTFKNSNIHAADYDTLISGFKRKLCYITTAVCEGLNKPSDCYELNLLKAYRDNYLTALPGGEAMIAQYYDMAPTIIKRVNKRKDHEDVYRYLYETYIKPCVQLIEQQRNEECREKYEEMVEMLRAEYL
ncbi:CFI-box-CTERM domain-containing protein [Lachnospiraceae bacterium JLR.KK008]